MNIYQKVNEVRKKIDYIKKDSQVGSGGYAYKAVTHDAVTSFVREQLITQGIVIIPSVASSHISQEGVSEKSRNTIRYEARFDVVFQNIDDTEDKFIISVDAHGNDTADKAPGKALSMATKYAMLKIFSIETGEDEESRFDEKKNDMAVNDDLVETIKAHYDNEEFLDIYYLSQKHAKNNEWAKAVHEARRKYKPMGKFDGTVNAYLKKGNDHITQWSQTLKAGISNTDETLIVETWSQLEDQEKTLIKRILSNEDIEAIKHCMSQAA